MGIFETKFYPKTAQEIVCFTYLAQTNNPFWGGETSVDQIAEQIARARGPSGSNSEYLLKLAQAIRTITTENDEHLYTLERLVNKVLSKTTDSH